MSTLYITHQGATLRKVHERLQITHGREVLADIPLIKVSQVVIFGKASITASTVAVLLEKKIDVAYLTQRGKYLGRIQPEYTKNAMLRMAQYKAASQPARTLQLAQSCVSGKLMNLNTLLKRFARRDEQIADACKKAATRIKSARAKAKKATNLDQLRGHEGDGSAAYFGVFNQLIKHPKFTFEKRVRRPPTDPVNALLSFGYALLTNDIYAAVNIVGLDPYMGYLHALEHGKPALPLDLMEEFRPIIVDSVVLDCLNHKALNPRDFREEAGNVVRLTENGRKIFLTQYDERKLSEFLHPTLKQTITYQRAFEQQVRFFAKTLQGELKEYPPLLIK